ncbi:MAG: chemotaxis protein CheA [Opitutales bacterium]
MPDSDPSKAFAAAFVEEAADLLEEIENTLMELEQNTSNRDLLDRLFRAIHTLKGSGSMFQFEALANFAHIVETVMDRARDGKIDFTEKLADTILRCRDYFNELLQAQLNSINACPDTGKQLETELKAYLETSASRDEPTDTDSASDDTEDDPNAEYVTWVYFKPDPLISKNGNDPAILLGDLQETGPSVVIVDDKFEPEDIEDFDPTNCYLSWDIFIGGYISDEAIEDVFLFVAEESDIVVNRIKLPGSNPPSLEEPPKIAAKAWEESPDRERSRALAHLKAAFTPQVPEQAATQPEAKSQCEAAPKTATNTKSQESIRVAAPRIDDLVNLVGELVINQSRLVQLAQGLGSAEMVTAVEETERLVGNLRNNVLSIRMMPVGTMFTKIKRLVRDLSQTLEKPVELTLKGSETELDKSVIDQLFDPLVHIIRNSMDHGIESAEQRAASGKPEKGNLTLEAIHKGASVMIRIQDDGGGLNAEKILQRAIERKIVPENVQLSENEIYDLIFKPGFSTAETISQVSGRGVGMDVVRRSIEELRGQIHLDSEPGKGTTLSLTLPLTLAIIDGLLVEVDRDRFIIPMSLVTENVEISNEERSQNNGRNLITVRGKQIPFLRLREVFQYATTPDPDLEKVVLLETDNGRIGFVVDRVIGTHQTVIQSLGRTLAHIDLVSGSTILGDGSVALILDVPGVVKSASEQDRSTQLRQSA